MPTFVQITKTDIIKSWKVIVAWSISISLLAVFTLSLFDFVKAQSAELETVLKSFPPEFLKAFGSDINTITSFTGYFNSKFLSLFLIMNSVLASYLGAVTLGKEISTGSILPIITKPLKRSTIYLAKFAAVIISLCISNLIVGLISFATALIFTNEEVSTQFFAVSFVGAFIFQVMFAAFGMCVGLIIGDNKTLMIGGGLAIAFMIVDAISTIDSVPTVVKYVSPYYYLALSHIAQFQELKPVIVYLVLVSIVITIAGVYLFKRKNIEI